MPCSRSPPPPPDSPPTSPPRSTNDRPDDADYTIRQAAYNLRKMRDKRLLDKPAARSATTSLRAARTIAALIALREQVIVPFLAGVRSPRLGRKPTTWTTETTNRSPFDYLGIDTTPAAA